MDSCCNYIIKTSFEPATCVLAQKGARQIQQWTLTRGAAPTTTPGGVIEPHATMEHGRASLAAQQAGPATTARTFGPAGPSHGLGPAGQTSWAVLPEDVPEDKPDVHN
jgi:hypothetical protein